MSKKFSSTGNNKKFCYKKNSVIKKILLLNNGNKTIQNGLSASSVEVINHVWEKNISLLIVVEGHTFEEKFTQIMSSTDQVAQTL